MPIGGSPRMGYAAASVKLDPKYVSTMITAGFFPDRCTLESETATQDTMGSLSYVWLPVPGYIKLPCLKSTRARDVPTEMDEPEIIDESKFWQIGIAGYYPKIDPAWRARMVGVRATGVDQFDIFDIIGIDMDSMRAVTVLRAQQNSPSAEPGL